jgi:alkanesulfonate monooxygenase SsuD/methylene tetrahydromethanopterin reductase-like flavin-dependent oxidoreductase (luciferase family)
MLKITMMLGSFHRLLGEAHMAQAVDVAKIVEQSGLYAIAIGEHVSLTSSLEGYPYAGGLRYADAGRKPYLEPAVLHGAFAAATSRLILSNCIMLAPLRPAVLLAKQLATIDGGEQPVRFRSETISFEGLYSMPRPTQKRIPILLALKANEKNAELVAQLCDGWETGPDDSKSLDKLELGIGVHRAAFAAAGRDPKSLIVKSHLFPQRTDQGEIDWDTTFANVPAMLDAGVTEFACAMPIGMKSPVSMDEIAVYMEHLTTYARHY